MLMNERLTKALECVPLTSMDERLSSPSRVSNLNSKTKRAKISGTAEPNIEQPVHDHLEENVITDQDIKMIMEQVMPQQGQQQPQQGQPQQPPAPMPEPEMGQTPEDISQGIEGEDEQGNEQEALPLDDDHTVEMVLNQLEGVMSSWLKISGNFPEGEKRHEFIELGERIREITGVLKRDFTKTAAENETEEPSQDLGETPPDEETL